MDGVGEYDVVSKFGFGIDIIDFMILFRNSSEGNDVVEILVKIIFRIVNVIYKGFNVLFVILVEGNDDNL